MGDLPASSWIDENGTIFYDNRSFIFPYPLKNPLTKMKEKKKMKLFFKKTPPKKSNEPAQIRVCKGATLFNQVRVEFPFAVMKPSPCNPEEFMNYILPVLQKEYKLKMNKDLYGMSNRYFYSSIKSIGQYDLSGLDYDDRLTRGQVNWFTVAEILWAFARTYDWETYEVEDKKYNPPDPDVTFDYCD